MTKPKAPQSTTPDSPPHRGGDEGVVMEKPAAPAQFGSMAGFQRVPLELIDEPSLPMREKMSREAMDELKASLALVGQLVPVILVKRGERFELLDGHRRYIAARELGWKELEAKFRTADTETEEATKVHANLMREGVNPAEEAIYYDQLLKRDGLDLDGLCRLVGRSPDYISGRYGLLRGDPAVFERLRDGTITLGVARALNRCEDASFRASFLDQAIRSGTSARVVEGWIQEWRGWQKPTATTPQSPPEPGGDSGVVPYHRECALCGGDKDQFNLEEVTLHRWEWAMLKDTIQRAMEKGLGLRELREGLEKIE